MVRISNKLLSFDSDKVHEYDIINNVWKKLDADMPRRTYNFGCAPVMNERYVVLFGGVDRYNFACDDIWIYSVDEHKFTKSKVKCPKKACYQAFRINDDKSHEMTVCGFVRNEWKLTGIADHLFPPYYLLKIIHKYCLQEQVHLFSNGKGTKHWRIDAFDIVC